MKKHDVAVVILNNVQLINIEPALNILLKKNYSIDIYCPNHEDKGYNKMFSNIRKILKEKGFNTYSRLQNIEYKVLLEPYPFMDIKAKYKIRYRYGSLSAKPDRVYLPHLYLKYDAIVCSGDYDANYLSAYSKTYKTGNMKYINFHKNPDKRDKKTLLYLPTFGDCSSIKDVIKIVPDLKKEFYVIAKVHHGTEFLQDEKKDRDELSKLVDEFYDSHKELSELLARANVVLTDNSGSIFEAIYTSTPVAVFCDDINKNKLEGFNTTQYELYKEGILPYTNNPEEVLKVIKEALKEKTIKKQNEWNKNNLHYPKDMTKDFVELVENHIKDNIDHRYYEMHNVLKNDYYGARNTIEELNSIVFNKVSIIEQQNNEIVVLNDKINSLNNKIVSLNDELNHTKNIASDLEEELKSYKTGKLYRISNKIYRFKGKFRRKK